MMMTDDYQTWRQAAKAVGGYYIVSSNEGAYEGMHPSDAYATQFAYRRCDRVGFRYEYDGLVGLYTPSDVFPDNATTYRGYVGTEDEIAKLLYEGDASLVNNGEDNTPPEGDTTCPF